jgi:tol-pal system protein YbgF
MAIWVAVGCALPTRTATLERDQNRLRDEVVTLQAKVTDLETKVATLSKRLGSVPNSKVARRDLDQRLSPIEERLGLIEQDRDNSDTHGADVMPPPPVPTPLPTPPPELDLDGLQREQVRQLPVGYEHGIALLREGSYEAAIQALRDFVRARHTSPFVVGAQYWIGQAHLQLGQSYQAILAFIDVQQRAPRGEYAPAAGLATGIAFQQLGNMSEARRAFEKVVADHPATPEAAKASARLRALE